MSEEPTVAAIIPTMNRADYLQRAVESVADQTYDNIEIVIVDGGSTDRTPVVVSEFQEMLGDGVVTYLRNEEPQGLPAARNQGVEATDTDYVAFLDDDDLWHPPKIEQQIERLDPSRGEGMCFTWVVSRTPEGEHVHTRRPDPESGRYNQLLVRNGIGTPSTVMATRDAFEAIGGFDEDLRYQEDWDFYIRMAQEYDIACVPKPLVTRISHANSMSSDVETQKAYRERILDRYMDERRDRGLEAEARAAHHRDTGITYCQNGDVNSGRREFRAALKYETDLSTLLLFLFSATGSRGFRTAVQTKRVANRITSGFS
jgi:glycosyltransferase involved in cell wall biosynthesis